MPVPRSNTPATLSLDFSGAEIRRGGGGDRVPEGDYLMQVVGVTQETKKDDPSRHYLRWKTVVVEPKSVAGENTSGKTIYNNTSLVPENLWALRTFLVDLLGEDKVPQSKVNIPLAKIVAAKPKFGATIADGEPYNGKIKSEIKATFNKSEWTALQSTTSDDDEDVEEAATADDGEDMDEIDVDDI
jgi:hypothetical protein